MPDIDLGRYEIDEGPGGNLVIKDPNDNTLFEWDETAGEWDFAQQSISNLGSLSTEDADIGVPPSKNSDGIIAAIEDQPTDEETVIQLRSGHYVIDDQIYLSAANGNSNITIRGQGENQTVLENNTGTSNPIIVFEGGQGNRLERPKIEQLRITGDGTGGAAIREYLCEHPIIENVSVDGTGKGFELEWIGENPAIRNCEVFGTDSHCFHGIGSNGGLHTLLVDSCHFEGSQNGDGVRLEAPTDGQVLEHKWVGNNIEDNAGHGVYLTGSGRHISNSFHANSIEGNSGRGIYIDATTTKGIDVVGGGIWLNDSNGVLLESSSNVSMSAVQMANNGVTAGNSYHVRGYNATQTSVGDCTFIEDVFDSGNTMDAVVNMENNSDNNTVVGNTTNGLPINLVGQSSVKNANV